MTKKLPWFRTKRFEHQGGFFVFSFLGGAVLLTGVVCLFYGILLSGAFVGQWHNIDLSLNVANMGCDFCLSDVVDHGFNLRGEHVNVTLEDSYIDSSFKLKQFWWYQSILMFMAGFCMCLAISFLVTSGIFNERMSNDSRRGKR